MECILVVESSLIRTLSGRGLVRYEKYLPKITEEDMRLISEPIDVYGQNIYNGKMYPYG